MFLFFFVNKKIKTNKKLKKKIVEIEVIKKKEKLLIIIRKNMNKLKFKTETKINTIFMYQQNFRLYYILNSDQHFLDM